MIPRALAHNLSKVDFCSIRDRPARPSAETISVHLGQLFRTLVTNPKSIPGAPVHLSFGGLRFLRRLRQNVFYRVSPKT
jgi:hypothetical protein